MRQKPRRTEVRWQPIAAVSSDLLEFGLCCERSVKEQCCKTRMPYLN